MNANAPNPWIPAPWRVRSVRRDSADVFTWELAPQSGSAPAFAPGQFNMIYRFGQGDVAISISGAGNEGSILHTIRAVGSVTQRLQEIEAGAIVGVRGPFGNGWPTHELLGGDVVIVAGGLGIAPLRPLIEWLLAQPSRTGRVDIVYGARAPEQLIYADDIERWRHAPNVNVHVTVDNADANWRGDVGTVTHVLPHLHLDPARTRAVLCGPEVMMRFTVLALQQEGLPTDAIWLSMERNMQCAVGYCGHCFYGPHFICRDGPVFRFDRLHGRLAIPEL